MTQTLDPIIAAEVARRRTFAIISHPDAGKTTLTEKFLLYCGAIREAGEVKAKAQRRKTVSDWMALEQQRGISVTSSVLQFEYKKLKINLLDTPGHQDFSEDTYRTLMAADSAVMVIDAAKGVEPQTRKLFEVCRMREIPIFTFVNKMDREGRDPFELLQEIENVLGIAAIPLTWPIGMGPSFKGVYHLLRKEFVFFEPSEKAGQMAVERSLKCAPSDKALLEFIEPEQQAKLVEEIDLIENGLGAVDRKEFLAGRVSPAVFGSARNNFGVPVFLDVFHDFAPGPQPKPAKPVDVKPDESRFSAFVFKIQANMDKAHRDRMAFMRICSGKFSRDMDVKLARTERTIRLSHSKQFVAQDRTTIDEAFAGDIIGVHDPGHFRIGDAVFTGPKVEFPGIPQFSPECFGRLRLKEPIKRKQLQKGVEQLCEEGLVQMFIQPHVGVQDPILGVVGVLQFDVMMFRLTDEYNVQVQLERLPYSHARWIRAVTAGAGGGGNTSVGGTGASGSGPAATEPALDVSKIEFRVPKVQDRAGNWVLLFISEWEMEYTKKNAPAGLEWSSAAF